MFVDVGHIAHLVLAAHGFRNFEENFPLAADIHGKSTVITTPTLVFPNLLQTPRQAFHAMLKFAVNEVLGVKTGVCIHSYFRVANNGNVVYLQEAFVLRREHPVPIASAVPVVGGDPPLSLMGMTAFHPSPQQFIFSIRTSCFQALPRLRIVSDRADFRTFRAFLGGLTMSSPLNLRNVQPSISKPSSMWVIAVFSSDSSKPLVRRKSRISSLSSSAIFFVSAVTVKSSA